MDGKNKRLTTDVGAPVSGKTNSLTAGERGDMMLQDLWPMEKLAHFDRKAIPERRMHAIRSVFRGISVLASSVLG